MLHIEFTQDARQHIKELYNRGKADFGDQIAIDYDTLIKQSIKDLAANPDRIGTRVVRKGPNKKTPDLRAYPLSFSNKAAGKKIKNPAHSVFYFTVRNDTLIISAVTRPVRHRYIGKLDVKEMIAEIEAQEKKADQNAISSTLTRSRARQRWRPLFTSSLCWLAGKSFSRTAEY